MGSPYASFDGMCWPVPNQRVRDIGWRMRYSNSPLSQEDMLVAASVIAAYAELINCGRAKRESVVAGIRDSQHGPQRGPSSVGKIEAERKQVEQQLRDEPNTRQSNEDKGQ